MDTRIAVIYYSATGNVQMLAKALAEGASECGCDVRLRRVQETAPKEAIEQNARWVEHLKREESSEGTPLVTLDDLAWADGLALGTPTRFGGPSAQLKAFLDQSGGLWAKGLLVNKVVTAFTAASTAHGGLESTILALLNVAYHWGSIVLPLGYTSDVILKQTGNPYGSTWISRKGSSPDEVALAAARAQGRRLANITIALKAGMSVAR
jgi:NAD(P)H dehydrogenase (quinone)